MFNIFPSLLVNDSDIDKAFGSMHKSIMMKIKNSVSEVWIVKTNAEEALRF